ncbi:S-adenosyl-L-methionine-dependent methyltransferase [Lipomyces chichibuensis]|uniref:S-adenosyl-L-methionine-dependent methyltransferase n=1 Tax=Lipomyces chichibuensis TaxID=1546026 RepID=UPI003344386C
MRLPPTTVTRAWRESSNLAQLLPEVRTIAGARTELRWIIEYVEERLTDQAGKGMKVSDSDFQNKVSRLCYLRGQKGVPLQYLLGSQPFGDSLDIKCRRGVLIPRWETEEWGIKIAQGIRRNHPFFAAAKPSDVDKSTEQADTYTNISESESQTFKVLDLCTGTGCLALLFAEQLRAPMAKSVYVEGVDRSLAAIYLARLNRATNARAFEKYGTSVVFTAADIFCYDIASYQFDIIIVNPPYVSEEHYYSPRYTTRSVRRFEPKQALLGGLEFYRRILQLAREGAVPAVVCEIADREQLRAIVDECVDDGWTTGGMRDSAGAVRTIIAWRKEFSGWSWMKQLIDV